MLGLIFIKLQNLDIILNASIDLLPFSEPGTIVSKQLYIPIGYKISGYTVSARVQTNDINNSSYRLKSTLISYSVNSSGLFKVSNTEPLDADGRTAEILYKVTK